ncbi:MAG: hypothetical protein H6Q00_1830 [Holophagaceae bacterium]|nr:hypothetical protein [Holophagaceae bacterium]
MVLGKKVLVRDVEDLPPAWLVEIKLDTFGWAFLTDLGCILPDRKLPFR